MSRACDLTDEQWAEVDHHIVGFEQEIAIRRVRELTGARRKRPRRDRPAAFPGAPLRPAERLRVERLHVQGLPRIGVGRARLLDDPRRPCSSCPPGR